MIIYVSHSSSNRELVEPLIVDLGRLGHDVQYEIKGVGSQVRWQQVFDSIKETDLFIAALTPELLASYSYEIERSYARALNKRVLLVMLDDTRRPTSDSIDYRSSNRNRRRNLAKALANLPAPQELPSPLPLPANWVAPLAELRKQVETLNNDFNKQGTLVLRLRDFLERQDSFTIANSLLELLRAHPRLHPEIAHEIDTIRDETVRIDLSAKQSQQKTTKIVGGVLGAMALIIVFLIVSQISQLRENRSIAVLLTSTVEALNTQAAAPTATPSATATKDVAITQTMLAVQVVLPSTTPTILMTTNTLLPSETATIEPSSTFTDVPPTATNLPTQTSTATITSTPTDTATATNTVMPSVTPTLPLQIRPTQTSSSTLLDFPQAVYVGMQVENTGRGIQVIEIGQTASAAGIHVGDYILAVDLTDVTTTEQFFNLMNTHTSFARVAMRVRQNGGIVTLTIVLGVNDFALPTQQP